MKKNIGELRARIDQLDLEIITLIAERFKVTEDIGIYKAQNKLKPQDRTREKQKFKELREIAMRYDLNPEYAQIIYRSIMDLVIERHVEIKKNKNNPL